MKITTLALAIAGLVAAAGANADAGEDLLKKSGCTACHAIDKKVVGPAYVDVAEKYKGDVFEKSGRSPRDNMIFGEPPVTYDCVVVGKYSL